jgi:hypothetical protein
MDRRNFRAAREFERQYRSPEDAPNPAVGAFVGISDGDPTGSPSCFTAIVTSGWPRSSWLGPARDALLAGWIVRLGPGRSTAIGPSVVTCSATLQSTRARETSIDAVAMLVAEMSSESVAGARGVGPQV